MSKLHEMTPLQKQFAEEHQNVVFRFLNQKGLPADDYYDIVIFGYLQAVQEYDENPALSHFRFSWNRWKVLNFESHFNLTKQNKRQKSRIKSRFFGQKSPIRTQS